MVFKAMGMEEIIKGVSEAGEKTWTKDLDLEHSNILRLDFVRTLHHDPSIWVALHGMLIVSLS